MVAVVVIVAVENIPKKFWYLPEKFGSVPVTRISTGYLLTLACGFYKSFVLVKEVNVVNRVRTVDSIIIQNDSVSISIQIMMMMMDFTLFIFFYLPS